MRRRALLATAGTVLGAGCLGALNRGPGRSSGTEPPTSDRRTDEPTTEPPHSDPVQYDPPDWERVSRSFSMPRTYALGNTYVSPADGIQTTVGFLRPATENGPTRVGVELYNRSNEELTLLLEQFPGFGALSSDLPRVPGTDDLAAEDDGLVLAPRAEHDLVDQGVELARGDDGYWRLAGDRAGTLPPEFALDPGERLRGVYSLVGRPDATGRPPGVYRFGTAEDAMYVTVWNSDRPGPTGESRFADRDVPIFAPSPPLVSREADDASAVGWYHAADAATTTYVRPSTEVADGPNGLSFTFLNHSTEEVSCGHWQFAKLVDGEWFGLGPFVHTADCRVVQPGGWKTWALETDRGGGRFGTLGGGIYAAVAGYGVETGETGALVELDRAAALVQLTDDAERRVEGGTAVVTTEFAGGTENTEAADLVLERTDKAATGRVIAEQVLHPRYRALRNALAAADGVDRVRVRTDDRRADGVLTYDTDGRSFSFRGEQFDVRVEGDDA